MSRLAAHSTAAPQASPADKWVSRVAAATVAALAGLAGAISYSHMRQLAAEHGQAGWHAHAFPLSVDGLELVASLVLFADRHRGRRSGWLPWAALITGTAGSLAANIATARPDAISRIIAGWPALALLIAVKLLSGILAHQGSHAGLAAPVSKAVGSADAYGRPGRASLPPSPVHSGPAGHGGVSRSRAQRQPRIPARRAATAHPSPDSGPPPAPGVDPRVRALLPAARTVREELERDGRALTRDVLAACLRQQGCQIRNSRVTLLLRALRDDAGGLSVPARSNHRPRNESLPMQHSGKARGKAK
jgi:hypothetical protein